jgi:hypothetical protein
VCPRGVEVRSRESKKRETAGAQPDSQRGVPPEQAPTTYIRLLVGDITRHQRVVTHRRIAGMLVAQWMEADEKAWLAPSLGKHGARLPHDRSHTHLLIREVAPAGE